MSQGKSDGADVQYQQQPQTADTEAATPEQLAPFFRGKFRPQPPEPPECQDCKRPLTVVQVTPVLFASELDDLTYRCESCGVEIKRTMKRP